LIIVFQEFEFYAIPEITITAPEKPHIFLADLSVEQNKEVPAETIGMVCTRMCICFHQGTMDVYKMGININTYVFVFFSLNNIYS